MLHIFISKKELLYFFKTKLQCNFQVEGGDQVNARCQCLDKVVKLSVLSAVDHCSYSPVPRWICSVFCLSIAPV